MIDFISMLMGKALRFFYDLTFNYGLAIILFTIFIKVILIPLNVMQQKSMKATQEVQPLLQKIQDKYKDNPQKQQEEMMKLYKEKNIKNPLGGCLLLFIQIPIILAMFYAIQRPVTFMFPEEIKKPEVIEELDKYTSVDKTYREVYYIEEKRIDLLDTNFLGLNLAQVPKKDLKNAIMWIIPVLSALTTYLTSRVSMKQSSGNMNPKDEASKQAMTMQKNMFLFMPLMTGYIAFIVPLGMGLYWLTNNIVSMIIQLWVMKKVNGGTNGNVIQENT